MTSSTYATTGADVQELIEDALIILATSQKDAVETTAGVEWTGEAGKSAEVVG